MREITETRDHVYYNMQDVRVSIYKNPSRAELTGALRRGKYGQYLRGLLLDNGDVLVWDGGLATHFEIIREYGIENNVYGLEIESPNEVAYMHNSLMNPDTDPDQIVEKMKTLPVFRGMACTHEEWRN